MAERLVSMPERRRCLALEGKKNGKEKEARPSECEYGIVCLV